MTATPEHVAEQARAARLLPGDGVPAHDQREAFAESLAAAGPAQKWVSLSVLV
jgi:hypothetical protein